MSDDGFGWSHGISENDLKKMGEIVLQWSAADFFIGNSLTFMFDVTDESVRREICSWSLSKKLRFLGNVPTDHPRHELVAEIRRHGLACLGERNRVAHSYALSGSSDGRASTVLTSNKGFEEWGQILGDEVMAAALIDRLLHHCHIVNIRGSSYRMRKHTDLSKILHSPPAESSPSPPKRKRARAKEKTTN